MPLLLRERVLRATPSHIPLCRFDNLFSLSSRNFKLGMVANVPDTISFSLQPPNHKYSTVTRPSNMSNLISSSSVWSSLNVLNFESCAKLPASMLEIGLWYNHSSLSKGRPVNISLPMAEILLSWKAIPSKAGRVENAAGDIWFMLLKNRKRIFKEIRPSHISALTVVNLLLFNERDSQIPRWENAPGCTSLMLFPWRWTAVAPAGIWGTSSSPW